MKSSKEEREVRRSSVRARGRRLAVRVAVLVASCLMTVAVPLGSAKKPGGDMGNGSDQVTLAVRVHNYAQVPPEVLTSDLAGAPRILSLAGVVTRFLVYDLAQRPERVAGQELAQAMTVFQRRGLNAESIVCTSSVTAPEDPACQYVGPTDVVVRIVPRHMAKAYSLPPGVFGFVPTDANGHHLMDAYVFYYLIEDYSSRESISRSALVGLAIAHEIGHLLLGRGSHSWRGLMQPCWRQEDFSYVGRSKLLFTSEQAEGIRSELRRRMTQAVFVSGLEPPR